jgi:hypothetical protein
MMSDSARSQLHVGFGVLGNHDTSAWNRRIHGATSNKCWVWKVSFWTTDGLAKVDCIFVVETSWFSDGINTLHVHDVVIGPIGESNANTHSPELISSHLVCCFVSLLGLGGSLAVSILLSWTVVVVLVVLSQTELFREFWLVVLAMQWWPSVVQQCCFAMVVQSDTSCQVYVDAQFRMPPSDGWSSHARSSLVHLINRQTACQVLANVHHHTWCVSAPISVT